MISISELKQRFTVRDVAPYGPCILVPGHEFNPDWEAELDVDVIQTDFGDPDKPFTLIPLKGEKPSGIPAVPKRHGVKGRSNLKAAKWKGEDEERLLERIGELSGPLEEKCKSLTKEFPGRSQASIHQKYIKLKRVKKAAEKKEEKPRKPRMEIESKEPSESLKPPLIRMDLANALAALVEAVGPENIQFSISIQIGSKSST